MKSAQWPKRSSNIWEFAPLFKWLLCYIVGILWYTLLGDGYTYPIIIVSLVCVLSTVVFALVSWNRALIFGLFPSMGLFVMCCAYLVCYSSSPEHAPNYFGNYLFHKNLLKAVIISEEKNSDNGSWYTVSIVSTDAGALRTGQAKIYIPIQNPMKLSCYDTLLVANDWQKIPHKTKGLLSATIPITYTQYIHARVRIIHCASHQIPWSFVIRTQCLQIWRKYVPNEQIVQLMYAMVWGNTAHLSPALVDSFTKAGVAHILALSGNNIELLVWLSWSLLYALKNKKLNWIKYVFSIAVIILYIYVCLISPSLLRAGIMCTVFFTASLIGRPHEPYNQLCTAAFILLCYQPMWLFSIGFQLSFVAVLSLLVWYRSVYNIFKVCPWYLHHIWRLIAASMAAEIFLAPLVLLHFHSFPMWFLLSNILAAVVFPVIALVALMLIGLQAIPMLSYITGNFFLVLIAWPIRGIEYLALHQPDSLQHIVFNISDVVLWYMIVYSINRLYNTQNIQSLKHVLLCIVCSLLWQCCETWEYNHKKEWILYTHGAFFHTISRIGAYYTLYGIEEDIPEIELQHLCNLLICNRNNLLISSQTMLIVGIDTVCIIKPMQKPLSATSYVVPHYTDAVMNYILTKSNIHTVYTTTINNKASYRTTARCLKKNIDIITLMPYALERIPY